MRFSEHLASRPLLLEGGLATELGRQGFDLSGPLWSARAIEDDPGALRRVHQAFASAGADVLCSASYQASQQGFARMGRSPEEADALMARSVTLAREAAPDRLIALSLGSYGAVVADGSEYTGAFSPPAGGLFRFHQQRLDAGALAGPDVVAFETIPALAEARAILEVVASRPHLEAWLSCSLRDGAHLSSGEPVETLAELVQPSNLVALGFNCAAPLHIAAACERLSGIVGLPLVAYPNRGERYDAEVGWDEGTARDPWEATDRLEAAGVRLWGGCCRTTPEDIARLRTRLHL